MRGFVLSALWLCVWPLVAFAGPPDGSYQNHTGARLVVINSGSDGFDFTLTANAPQGDTTCPEGASDCLQIDGHADAGGTGFVYIDPQDDRSRMFFGEDANPGVKVLSTTGNLGTGTANRAAMLALTGAYGATGVVQTDSALLAGHPAMAGAGGDALAVFQSPTGNIACRFTLADPPQVRCDLLQLNRSFTTPPPGCDLDWGDSFSVTSGGGRAGLVCHGDTVADPQAQVLQYGRTVSFGGISCVSSTAGISCQTAQGHGFSLSRKR